MKGDGYIRLLIIGIIGLLIGLILGVVLQSHKPVEIDHKIRYSELLNWITTMMVGVLVGYFLRNQYENSKTVKSYILDDIKGILLDLRSTSELFVRLKAEKSINEDHRRDINSRMNVIDKKINVFCELLQESYKNSHKPIKDQLVNTFNAFNKSITGDGLYDPSAAYFDDVVAESSKFESFLRILIFRIIKDL